MAAQPMCPKLAEQPMCPKLVAQPMCPKLTAQPMCPKLAASIEKGSDGQGLEEKRREKREERRKKREESRGDREAITYKIRREIRLDEMKAEDPGPDSM